MIVINMYIEKVKPIIIYPSCLIKGKKQDCFNCGNKNTCISPRSLCTKPYHNHPNGCPNYGKKAGCPPNIEMFNEIYDMNKDIYAIITFFNIKSHLEKMRKLHPNWTHNQLINSRYWQGTDKKNHKQFIAKFNILYPEYIVTTWPEALGVNLIETLKQINIDLKFPIEDISYRISLAGIIPDENFENYNLCIKKGKYKERILSKK